MIAAIRRLLGRTPSRRGQAPEPQQRGLAAGSGAPLSSWGPYYPPDALAYSTARQPLLSWGVSQNATQDRYRLATLANRLVENHGLASYAVRTLQLHSVPLGPQASTGDRAWNTAAEDYWTDWAARADYTRRFSFRKLLSLACRALDTDGDVGFLAVRDAGEPRIMLIDGWRICNPAEAPAETNIDGARVDRTGRVLGYWVQTASDRWTPYDANEFALIMDPDRGAQYRGLSPFRRGANDLRDANEIKALEKIAVKLFASMPAVIRGAPAEGDYWGNDSGTDGNDQGSSTNPNARKLTLWELIGGDIPILQPGQELSPMTNDRPGDKVLEFLGSLVAHFVCSLDIPPAFFLDDKLTGPNQRAVLAKAQRTFDERFAILADALRWVWVRVIADAIARGDLAPAPAGWGKISVQAPQRLTIDAGREAQQDREDVRAGLKTRQTLYGDQGRDWQRETDQALAETDYIIGRAKELATRQGVPVELVLSTFGLDAQAAQPPQPDKPQTAADDEEDMTP